MENKTDDENQTWQIIGKPFEVAQGAWSIDGTAKAEGWDLHLLDGRNIRRKFDADTP